MELEPAIDVLREYWKEENRNYRNYLKFNNQFKYSDSYVNSLNLRSALTRCIDYIRAHDGNEHLPRIR